MEHRPAGALSCFPTAAAESQAVLGVLGSYRYSPEDLTSFAAEAGTVQAIHKNGEHIQADVTSSYKLPAREEKGLNSSRSMQRRSGPG